MIAAKVAF